MKIFVYNDFLKSNIQNIHKLNITNREYAITQGKLIYYAHTPLLFKTNDIKFNKHSHTVYGMVLTIEGNEEHILYTLDSYHSCLETRLNTTHKQQLTNRELIQTNIICFDNIQELLQYQYSYVRKEECIAYCANINNDAIVKHVTSTNVRKIKHGFYVSGMKDTLKQGGYL